MRQPQSWATNVDFLSPLGRSATPSESKDAGHQGPALHGAILPLKLPEFAKTRATPLTVANFSCASEAPLSSIHSSPSVQPFSPLPTIDRRTNRRNLSQHQIVGFISNFQLKIHFFRTNHHHHTHQPKIFQIHPSLSNYFQPQSLETPSFTYLYFWPITFFYFSITL